MTRATRIGDPVIVRGSGGNRIACQIAGPRTAQPVVLTSGIGCGPVFFRHIAPVLARDYRLVFWDYRAHGGSDLAPDDRSYRIADHADDLESVVSALTDRPPFMVGFSMGVQVTLEWTKRHDASEVPGYVFLLGMPRNPLGRHWFWGSKRMRTTVDRVLDAGAGHVIRRLHPVSKAILRNRFSYAVAKEWGLVNADFDYDDYHEFICYSSGVRPDAYLRTATGVLEHDAIDAWKRLDKPTLFVAGGRDMLVPADECRSVAHHLSGGRYDELEGRSHAGMVEAGPELAVRVKAFLDARYRERLEEVPFEAFAPSSESRPRPFHDHPIPFEAAFVG